MTDGVSSLPTEADAEISSSGDGAPGLAVVWTDRIFGSEPLAARAPALRELQETPFLLIGEGEAAAWQLADGAMVAIGAGEPPWELTVRVVTDMADGIVVLPRLPGWQQVVLPDGRLQPEDIHHRS